MIYIYIVVFLFFVFNTKAQSTIPINNNQILSGNITSGVQQHYFFSTNTGKKRDNITPTLHHITKDIFSSSSSIIKRDPINSSSPIYLTLTSCSQPTPPSNYVGNIPTIDLYISTNSSNTLPGPKNNQNNNSVDKSNPGRISWQSNNTNNLWIGIVAPTLTEGWQGEWKYEIGISTSQWMHPLYSSEESMILEDTDSSHALFLTKPIQTTNASPNITTMITLNVPKELQYSYCAIKSYQVSSISVNITSVNKHVPEGFTQQYIMVSNLTQSQTYTAYMIETLSGSITGISVPLLLQMKNDSNCRLIYNLDFCDQVAYSVATDPNQDIWNITRSYDEQAKALFDPFNTALSQYNCNNTQYSLVRTCDDCYRDYKRWLCSVTIPRCTTLSSSEQQQQDNTNNDNKNYILPTPSVRNVLFNQSRNRWIDETYQLNSNGWTELLPCIDLCYQVVQSCPPFLQFNCPEGELAQLQYGYWKTQLNTSLGPIYDVNHPTCNRVGMNTSLLVISSSPLNFKISYTLLILSLIFNIYIYI